MLTSPFIPIIISLLPSHLNTHSPLSPAGFKSMEETFIHLYVLFTAMLSDSAMSSHLLPLLKMLLSGFKMSLTLVSQLPHPNLKAQ